MENPEVRGFALRVKLVFTLILTVLLLGILEGGARLYLSLVTPEPVTERKYAFDELLGWRLLDGEHRMVNQDFSASYTVGDGKRRTIHAPGVKTGSMNFFGDSFAFGIGVQDSQTIESLVAADLPSYSVTNYGVSGYAPDQYFLNFRQHASPGDINVFIILTSNDYHEIVSRRTLTSYEKPWLEIPVGGRGPFAWHYPNALAGKGKDGGDLQAAGHAFQSSFVLLLKRVLKGNETVVRLRNHFVKPDAQLVDGAMSRIEYLFGKLDKRQCYFVIFPSYSLVTGVSSNTSEGLFARRLHELLSRGGYRYADLYADSTLSEADYWPHEGHPNAQGNAKAAAAIVQMLRPYLPRMDGSGENRQ